MKTTTATLEPPVQQALERGRKTLEAILTRARPRDVGSLQSTANEAAFLIEAARMAVESGCGPQDPAEKEFHAARLRGLSHISKLRKMAEPCLDAASVCDLLGVSRETIRKKVDRRQLLALPKGSEDRVYPAFQFDGGAVLTGLAAVLAALNTDPFVALSFLLGRHRSLGNVSAIESLKAGKTEEVLAEAGSFLQQGG